MAVLSGRAAFQFFFEGREAVANSCFVAFFNRVFDLEVLFVQRCCKNSHALETGQKTLLINHSSSDDCTFDDDTHLCNVWKGAFVHTSLDASRRPPVAHGVWCFVRIPTCFGSVALQKHPEFVTNELTFKRQLLMLQQWGVNRWFATLGWFCSGHDFES